MARNRSRPRKPCPFSSLLRFIGSLLRGKPSSQHVRDVPDEFMSAHAPQEMTGSLYSAQPFLHGAPPPLPAAYYAQGKDVQWTFNARPIRPALPAEWYLPAYPSPPSSSAPSAYYTAESYPAPSFSSSSYTAVSTPATAATYASSTATTALPYPPHPSYPPQTASTRAAHGHAASSSSRPLVAHGHAAPSSSRTRVAQDHAPPSSSRAQHNVQTSGPRHAHLAQSAGSAVHVQRGDGRAPGPSTTRAQDNIQTSGPRHLHLAQSAGGAVHVQRGDGRRPATRAHAQFYTAWHDPQFSQAYDPARANDSVVVQPSRTRRY